MAKSYFRTPRFYDGTLPTGRRVTDLLPHVLAKIEENHSQRSDLILAFWPEVIGPKLAAMTQALSFSEGVLVVKVKNSTLYSLLSRNDKFRILNMLRNKFPHAEIKNIFFRIG